MIWIAVYLFCKKDHVALMHDVRQWRKTLMHQVRQQCWCYADCEESSVEYKATALSC